MGDCLFKKYSLASSPGITVAAADRFDAGMHIQMALREFEMKSPLEGIKMPDMIYLIRISGHEPFPTLFTLKCLSRLFSMVAPVEVSVSGAKTVLCAAPDVTVKVVLVVEQLSTLRAGQCWGKV